MALKGLLKETYGAILTLALPPLAVVFKNKLIQIFPSIESWFWIAIISTGLSLILVVYILYNRPKYCIDKETSCYLDKKGNKFCPVCMANRKRVLVEERGNYLRCFNFDECHFDKNKDGSSTGIFSIGTIRRDKILN